MLKAREDRCAQLASTLDLLSCARVGDAVFGQATGCLGTAVVADAATLVPVPTPLALEQAATVPTVFLTADASLRQSCALRAGQRVLVHAATGAVTPVVCASANSACAA